jgi:phospholipase C
MKKHLERTYGKAVKGLIFAVNPLKKMIMKTHCTVHKFINLQAIDILKNEGYDEEYGFYKKYVKPFNHGVAWADQDLKSSNHFYHYEKEKGLYGFSDALTECKKYYAKALKYIELGEADKCLFYFGAACHLVQDTTVPQHVNNKLLKSHRSFEMWIIGRLLTDYSFPVHNGINRFESLREYFRHNAREANRIYDKYYDIASKEERYHKVATETLREAQMSTAGFMLDFYDDIKKYITAIK